MFVCAVEGVFNASRGGCRNGLRHFSHSSLLMRSNLTDVKRFLDKSTSKELRPPSPPLECRGGEGPILKPAVTSKEGTKVDEIVWSGQLGARLLANGARGSGDDERNVRKGTERSKQMDTVIDGMEMNHRKRMVEVCTAHSSIYVQSSSVLIFENNVFFASVWPSFPRFTCNLLMVRALRKLSIEMK